MPDDLWQQGLPTLLVALVASWVFLLYRYHGSGRPFGSGRCTVWSVSVVLVMSLVATVLGLGLDAAAVIPPVLVGLVAPAMLGAHRMEKAAQPPDGKEVLFGAVTIGIKLLLDRLEWQMSLDRESWCEGRLDSAWTLEQLDEAGLDLYTTLYQRQEDRDRHELLESDRDALTEAVTQAEKANTPREFRRARHAADQAFLAMLRRAYDWSCLDVRPVPLPATRRPRTTRRLQAAPDEAAVTARKTRRRLDPT